jgi:hypothetical protein
MRQFAYNVCSFVFQVLTFAAVVVGVVAIWLQVRALNQQYRTQQAAVRQLTLPTVINLLESPAVRAARQTVETKLAAKPLADWTDADRSAADEALDAFDLAAALARRDEIDAKLLLDHWSHDLATLGRTCRDYIATRRAKDGRGYLANFLWLEAEANKLLAEQDLAK